MTINTFYHLCIIQQLTWHFIRSITHFIICISFSSHSIHKKYNTFYHLSIIQWLIIHSTRNMKYCTISKSTGRAVYPSHGNSSEQISPKLRWGRGGEGGGGGGRESVSCRFFFFMGQNIRMKGIFPPEDSWLVSLIPCQKPHQLSREQADVLHTFWMSSSSSLDFFRRSKILSMSSTASTCLSMMADFMMSRQFLSTVEKRRPSSGIWAMMSGEEKMGSRYSQVACTLSHSSRMSCSVISLLSQSLHTHHTVSPHCPFSRCTVSIFSVHRIKKMLKTVISIPPLQEAYLGNAWEEEDEEDYIATNTSYSLFHLLNQRTAHHTHSAACRS